MLIEAVQSALDVRLAYAAAAALVSGLVVGFAGFGGGLLMSPLFAVIFGPTEAVFLVMLASLVGGAQLIPQVRRRVAWQETIPVVVSGLVLLPLGSYLLLTVDPIMVRRTIGAIVFAFAVIMLTGWGYRGPRGPLVGSAMGAVAGVLAGIGAVSGPIFTLYFLSSSAPAAVSRANILVVGTSYPVMGLAILWWQDVITVQSLVRFAAVIFPHAGAILLGARIFNSASDTLYRRVALWFILAVGALAVAL
jgi:uncharacterized membrane protein YfcA